MKEYSSNKTIAKNTLFLYFRMMFTMAIHLYTSRVILQILGVNDFGIYHNIFNISNNTRIFSLFDDKSIDILLNENSTLYYHQKGFDKNDFLNNKDLSKEFIISSLSKDKNEKIFVNSIESSNKSENTFGIQFHNDYIIYDRSKNSSLNNHKAAVKIVTLLNSFIVETARKNKNKFPIENREIYNFFDLYSNKTNYSNYDKEHDIFYFKRPKVEVKIHIFTLFVIICFECIILFTIGNAFYHFWYKYEEVEINNNDKKAKLISEND